MFDAAAFFTLLIIGFVLLVAKFQYREFFQALAAVIFLVLGFVTISGTDILFLNVIDDGTSPITETTFVLGDGTANYGAAQYLTGVFLILLAIISSAVCLLSWIAWKPPKGNQ